MTTYPTADHLAAMGHTLQRDVCLWSATLAREYYTNDYSLPNVPAALLPKRNHNKSKGSAPRQYRSRFVGVTVHRDRWLAQWGAKGAIKGRVFPLTPEGEIAAATERAKALGLSALELRPLHQVAPRDVPSAPRDVPSAPLDPRGPHQTPLGGKRVA